MPLTLACLFDQTIRPDRIILWIAHDDAANLDRQITCFRSAGLDIRTCDDLGPYKKLIPTLEDFPEAFIVTADDDIYYPRDWLESLVAGHDGHWIAALRAHPIEDGIVNWRDLAGRHGPGFCALPTSGAGMLFPPRSLHPDVLNADQFLLLCAAGDDLWYYWMALKAGTPILTIGERRRLICWSNSQDCALWNTNRAGGNDEMFRALGKEFGADLQNLCSQASVN